MAADHAQKICAVVSVASGAIGARPVSALSSPQEHGYAADQEVCGVLALSGSMRCPTAPAPDRVEGRAWRPAASAPGRRPARALPQAVAHRRSSPPPLRSLPTGGRRPFEARVAISSSRMAAHWSTGPASHRPPHPRVGPRSTSRAAIHPCLQHWIPSQCRRHRRIAETCQSII